MVAFLVVSLNAQRSSPNASNAGFREKSMSLGGGDSKIIEEKLDAVSDLKTQIRALINDNEDVKMNQEELNANMAGVNKQVI